jgi:hypothetical protein
MDEQYELISKQSLSDLKEENKKLKEQLKNQNTTTKQEKNSFQEQFLVDIKEMLAKKHDEEKRELFTQLSEIKELNKTTLNNVLQKTQGLDLRLEDMIDTLKKLVSTMSEVIHETKGEEEDTLFEKEDVNSIYETEVAKIAIKLEDIETFMKNLRILLSYLEPTKVSLNKPQMPSLELESKDIKQMPPTLNL